MSIFTFTKTSSLNLWGNKPDYPEITPHWWRIHVDWFLQAGTIVLPYSHMRQVQVRCSCFVLWDHLSLHAARLWISHEHMASHIFIQYCTGESSSLWYISSIGICRNAKLSRFLLVLTRTVRCIIYILSSYLLLRYFGVGRSRIRNHICHQGSGSYREYKIIEPYTPYKGHKK